MAATCTSATSTLRRWTRTSRASGRCLTDADGAYAFTTIKPGPYPWKNHRNAWRPAHIHFSLFGTDFTQRLVTQMYFPGDPLFALDPIYQAIVDPAARDAAGRDLRPRRHRARVVHGLPLGHRADREPPHAAARRSRDVRPGAHARARPSGPSSPSRSQYDGDADAGRRRPPRRGHLRGRVLDGAGQPVPDALVELWQADARRRRVGRRARCAATATFTRLGSVRHRRRRPLWSFSTAPAPGARPFFAAHRLRPRPARPAVHPRLPPGPPRTTRCCRSLTAERRRRSCARADERGLVFDIRLQGEGETVFLAYPRD